MSAREANLEYKIRRFAVVVASIQSLVWICLSTICITLFLRDTINLRVDSYMGVVNSLLYMMFLARQRTEPPFTQSLRPPVFFAFMWAYLIADMCWFYASVQVLKKKSAKCTLPSRIRNWSYITLVVCFIDLLTVIILGADYNKCLSSTVEEAICVNSILPVLVIAAKGFILWIVNVIFAVVLYNMSRTLQRNVNETSPPVIHQPYTESYPGSAYSNTAPISPIVYPVNQPNSLINDPSYPVNQSSYPVRQPSYPASTLSGSGGLANSMNNPKHLSNRYRGATPYRFQQ